MRYDLALGFGDNVDCEIEWDSGVLEALAEKHGVEPRELDIDTRVTDERSLVVSILSFLSAGEGGERFATDPDLLDAFCLRFKHAWTLGGTPIRAAIAVAKLGYDCALHYVTMNDHVRRLTPPGCAYVCACEKEASFPHLIVQFKSGDEVKVGNRRVRAPRANRIIYDNDPDNISMPINEDFARFCREAKVFLASGFNAMQDARLLETRLDSVKRVMESLPPAAVRYYEDGGFYDDRLRSVIREKLDPLMDIHGMNEDELQNYVGRRVNLLDAEEIARALQDARSMIPSRTLLVHTQYWALTCGENARELQKALNGGIFLAGTRYRFGDGFTVGQYENTQSLPRSEKGSALARELNDKLSGEVCCVPSVSAPEKNVTTIGLGDAFVGGFLSTLSEVAYKR